MCLCVVKYDNYVYCVCIPELIERNQLYDSGFSPYIRYSGCTNWIPELIDWADNNNNTFDFLIIHLLCILKGKLFTIISILDLLTKDLQLKISWITTIWLWMLLAVFRIKIFRMSNMFRTLARTVMKMGVYERISLLLLIPANTLYAVALVTHSWFELPGIAWYGLWWAKFCDQLGQCHVVPAFFTNEPGV